MSIDKQSDKKLPFKNGGTFKLTFKLKTKKGTINSFDGLTIKGSIRLANGFKWNLVIEVADDGRSFTATYNGSTNLWATGDAEMDLLFIRQSDGLMRHSTTLPVKIGKGITLN